MNDGLGARVADLEQTIYRGNGEPSLLSRVKEVETRQEFMVGRQDSIEKRQERWEKIAWTMLASAMLGTAGLVGRTLWEVIVTPHIR